MFVALSLLLVAVCAVPGLGKLSSQPRIVATAGHFHIPWARYRMLGFAELAAALGVLAGLVWPPIGIAAAFGMAVLLVGALVMHRRAGDSLKEAASAVVGLLVTLAYLAAALPR